jgi:hypothetical protein
MKALVCGGRTFEYRLFIWRRLDSLHKRFNITLVITGGARGADFEGILWAKSREIPFKIYHAHWDLYGKSAGYIRNEKMLEEEKPDVVIAFPGGVGTDHMRNLAFGKGYKVINYNAEFRCENR